MIDLHSHILPCFDDGAADPEVSLKMLKMSADGGVGTVVSTSHFYSDRFSDADDFVRRRRKSFDTLSSHTSEKSELPRIVLGAEVYLDRRLHKIANLHDLCIENTDFMMLEMPFDKWEDDDFEEIYKITRLGIYPIMAHLDRFMKFESLFPELFSLGVLVQVNADAIIDRKKRKHVLRLFEKDAVHAVGSDMHNLTSRPPNLAEAYGIIGKNFGSDYRRYLEHSSECILKNDEPPLARIHKIKGIQRIFL